MCFNFFMRDSLPAFKKSLYNIYWRLPYQRVRNLHYQCTFLSFALVFQFFSYFVFACTFLFFILWSTRKKHIKCKRICKLFSCFYFPQAYPRPGSNRKWNFTSLEMHALARINRLMDPSRFLLSPSYFNCCTFLNVRCCFFLTRYVCMYKNIYPICKTPGLLVLKVY